METLDEMIQTLIDAGWLIRRKDGKIVAAVEGMIVTFSF